MEENNTIIILKNSENAKSFAEPGRSNLPDPQSLIHRNEFLKAIELISKCIPQNDFKAEEKNLHNTFTILGSRGSGKTSFLLGILDVFRSNNEKIGGHSIGEGLEVLKIIDPTLIEEKGHVFLNVISRIVDLVDPVLDKIEFDRFNYSNSDYSRNEWRNSLNALAAGLPSIDGIGSSYNDGWQDPEFVMDNGLKSVDSALKLTDNFNEFVKISLRILKKKAFLLMFDDIDVDATKGWPVLETLRKYFTGARIITIVSGDLKLYSTAIRQKKWKNFGDEILMNEGSNPSRKAEFNDIITELESQYLQKVLPVRHRIHLLTLGEQKLGDSKKQFNIYEDLENTSMEGPSWDNDITTVYRRILSYFGINNAYQSNAYTTFLLGMPIRSQIQFLSLFNIDNGKLKNTKSGVNSIVDIFISDLYAKGVDSNSLARFPKNINRLILQFLLKEKKIEELYQLQPISTDASLNASLLTFNFLLSYRIQNNDSYLIFDYLIKVGYIRNLLPLLKYRKDKESGTPSIEELCENSVVLNDNVLKDITGRIIAYVRGAIDQNTKNSETISRAGTIPLFGKAANAKRGGNISDRIDNVLDIQNADGTERMLVLLPLSANQYVYKQSSLLTYSSFLLIAAIGELCRRKKVEGGKLGFTELSQLRAYVMPDFKRGDSYLYEGDESSEESDSGDSDTTSIETLFDKWVDKFPENLKISSHLLGKISTRFYFAVSNLENKIGLRKLGEIFSAHILAFLNAVLIEDCREHTELAAYLNMSNTNYSDKIFYDNLQKVLGNNEDLSKNGSNFNYLKIRKELVFSRWILGCPLLLPYIKKDESLKSSLRLFCKEENYDISPELDIDLSRFLDKIEIRQERNVARETGVNEDNKTAGEIRLYSRNFPRVLSIFESAGHEIETILSFTLKEFQELSKRFGVTKASRSNFDRFKEFLSRES